MFNQDVHSAKDGVSCLNRFNLNNNCLLSENESHKEAEICRKSE